MKNTNEMLKALDDTKHLIRMLYESDTFHEYYRFGGNENDLNSFIEKHFEDIKKLILAVKDY